MSEDKLAHPDDVQAALDWINFFQYKQNTVEVDNLAKDALKTIRSALTAQQPDVNQELLEALKEVEWSKGGFCPICGGSIHGTIGGEIIKKHKDDCKIGKAIARAEQKGEIK